MNFKQNADKENDKKAESDKEIHDEDNKVLD